VNLEEKSAASGHRSTGFDYLRIGLSLAVLSIHCLEIADFPNFKYLWGSSFGALFSVILPSFFALSGYLVAGSLTRNTIPGFITLRFIRIFPALAVEIFLTAFIVGTIFTVLPLHEYFHNRMFFNYFQNAIGIIHYPLPGVFQGAPANMQLWTIPFEFECYFVLVAMGLVGLHRNPRLFLAATLALYVGFSVYFAIKPVSISNQVTTVGQNVSGKVLVLCFLFGCVLFLLRKTITFSLPIFILCLAFSYITLLSPKTAALSAPAVAYATIYLGLLRPPALPFGDLSYGVFLFHSPVARSLYEIFNHSIGTGLLTAFTLVLTSLFAALSWRLVERPILNKKGAILAVVNRALNYPRVLRENVRGR
jgi:peptidoglycan/LPS O-acetylase OafA/YrhL